MCLCDTSSFYYGVGEVVDYLPITFQITAASAPPMNGPTMNTQSSERA